MKPNFFCFLFECWHYILIYSFIYFGSVFLEKNQV